MSAARLDPWSPDLLQDRWDARRRGAGRGLGPVGRDGIPFLLRDLRKDDAFDLGGDMYLLAKTYFDFREYRLAAHVLQNQVRRKALFLRCYALYMWTRNFISLYAELQFCQSHRVTEGFRNLQVKSIRGLIRTRKIFVVSTNNR